jgi:Uma2 family endonuclease
MMITSYVLVMAVVEDFALRHYAVRHGWASRIEHWPRRGRRHQRVVLRLAGMLDAHVTTHDLGEVDIAPFDVVRPNILFVAADRSTAFSNRGFEGPPTLVVEVLSRWTAQIDRGTKLQLYARHRVPHYWIVDPDGRTIDVHLLAASAYGAPKRFSGDSLVALPPFPGLTLDPVGLWP